MRDQIIIVGPEWFELLVGSCEFDFCVLYLFTPMIHCIPVALDRNTITKLKKVCVIREDENEPSEYLTLEQLDAPTTKLAKAVAHSLVEKQGLFTGY
ncbi:hypothetical protein Plhal304r1_c002g0006801 [Plasmopara halstedii]